MRKRRRLNAHGQQPLRLVRVSKNQQPESQLASTEPQCHLKVAPPPLPHPQAVQTSQLQSVCFIQHLIHDNNHFIFINCQYFWFDIHFFLFFIFHSSQKISYIFI